MSPGVEARAAKNSAFLPRMSKSGWASAKPETARSCAPRTAGSRKRALQETLVRCRSATPSRRSIPRSRDTRDLPIRKHVAVDVSLPRPEGLARAAAVPARLLLAGLVAVSFGLRFAAALVHTTPLYFQDEYIYGTIPRPLAERARRLIRV